MGFAPNNEPLRDYEFEPLGGGKHIRVLYLHPATTRGEELNTSLTDIDLEKPDAPKFEALSWCWGSQIADQTLRISVKNGVRQMKITKNLAAALKCLRLYDSVRILWVDAICINQKNVRERNHQVAMMNLVYGRSSSVCVWLDDNEPTGKNRHFDAGIAFDFIKEHVLDLWNFDKVCEEEVNSKKWVALVHLMTKPWFSRRWVIQEIALAPRATIHCGSHSMDWRGFADAVSLFVEAESATHRLSEVVKGDKQFNHIQGLFADVHTMGATLLIEMTSNLFRRTAHGSLKPLSSLEHLVSRLSMFESSEVRDTIYALLAIARDSEPQSKHEHATRSHHRQLRSILDSNKKLAHLTQVEKDRKIQATVNVVRLLSRRLQLKSYEVTYDKPELDVYKQFVEFCIRQSDSLDIVCRPWAPQPPPKKSSEQESATSGFSQQRTGRSMEALTPMSPRRKRSRAAMQPMPSWIADKKNTAFILSHHDVTRVKMERRNADPLVGLPERRIYHAAGDLPVRRRWLQFRRRDEYDQSLLVEGFVLDVVNETTLPAMRGNIPEGWLELIDWNPDEDNYAPAEFCRTLVADRGSKGDNPPPFYERACTEVLRLMKGLEALDTLGTINGRQCTIIAEFLRRVREVIFNRQLIRTKGKEIEKDKEADRDKIMRYGSLGIAPQEARVDDQVCIFYGCSVPIILRRCEKTQAEQDQELKSESDQYPDRLLRAVQTIEKHFTSWKHSKKVIEEWEHENPEKAKARNVKMANSRLFKASSSQISTPGTSTFPQSAGLPYKTEIASPEAMSATLANVPESMPHDEKTSEYPVSRPATEPFLLRRAHTAPLESPLQRSDTSFYNRAGSRFMTPRDSMSEDAPLDLNAKYKKMCANWRRIIKTDNYHAKSKVHLDLDNPIDEFKIRQKYYYKVIGECYIDEMMNGEALEARTNEQLEDVVFELR